MWKILFTTTEIWHLKTKLNLNVSWNVSHIVLVRTSPCSVFVVRIHLVSYIGDILTL